MNGAGRLKLFRDLLEEAHRALDLQFGPGLTALTGETGAGKSIVLDALGLACGERADAVLVRPGARQAIATAVFHPPAGHPVWRTVEDGGFDGEDGCSIACCVGHDEVFVDLMVQLGWEKICCDGCLCEGNVRG